MPGGSSWRRSAARACLRRLRAGLVRGKAGGRPRLHLQAHAAQQLDPARGSVRGNGVQGRVEGVGVQGLGPCGAPAPSLPAQSPSAVSQRGVSLFRGALSFERLPEILLPPWLPDSAGYLILEEALWRWLIHPSLSKPQKRLFSVAATRLVEGKPGYSGRSPRPSEFANNRAHSVISSRDGG